MHVYTHTYNTYNTHIMLWSLYSSTIIKLYLRNVLLHSSIFNITYVCIYTLHIYIVYIIAYIYTLYMCVYIHCMYNCIYMHCMCVYYMYIYIQLYREWEREKYAKAYSSFFEVKMRILIKWFFVHLYFTFLKIKNIKNDLSYLK